MGNSECGGNGSNGHGCYYGPSPLWADADWEECARRSEALKEGARAAGVSVDEYIIQICRKDRPLGEAWIGVPWETGTDGEAEIDAPGEAGLEPRLALAVASADNRTPDRAEGGQ